MSKPDILVIGAGLSGLLAAYLLRKEGFAPKILEARNRAGGRIYTFRSENEPSIEMGATWLGNQHHHLLDLLDELDIGISEQFMGNKGFYEPMSVSPPQLVELPPIRDPSYRIEGGTDSVIQALVDHLGRDQILHNQVVNSIRKTDAALEIHTETDSFKADFIISTLPPKLLVDRIHFSPSLPDELTGIAAQTHTWMAESIKVALTFDEPFWRNPELSGTIFSSVGPVNEMYDHSGNNQYALKGFMNSAYQTVSRERRKELVTEQLRRFYGDRADRYLTYQECVWGHDPFTFSPYEQSVLPHQNNGHSIYQESYLENRLFIAGAETATEFSGYMDGAVESAYRVVRQIKRLISI